MAVHHHRPPESLFPSQSRAVLTKAGHTSAPSAPNSHTVQAWDLGAQHHPKQLLTPHRCRTVGDAALRPGMWWENLYSFALGHRHIRGCLEKTVYNKPESNTKCSVDRFHDQSCLGRPSCAVTVSGRSRFNSHANRSPHLSISSSPFLPLSSFYTHTHTHTHTHTRRALHSRYKVVQCSTIQVYFCFMQKLFPETI